MTALEEATAARIKARRVERGLTQRDMGEKLGISHVAVGDIERGKTHLTLALLERLATVLDTTVGDLTGDAVPHPAPHAHSWMPGGFQPAIGAMSAYQVLVCSCGMVVPVGVSGIWWGQHTYAQPTADAAESGEVPA